MKIRSRDLRILCIQYAQALIIIVILGGILIRAQGESPAEALKYILEGAVGSPTAIANTLRWATPCMFTGAAVTLAFKSGIMNCGIQGQVYTGALTAAIIGYALPMPKFLHMPICILAAGIVGMLYALIPALMKLYLKVDELITTLMLCFVATYLTEYIVIWMIIGEKVDATRSMANTSPNILETAEIPKLIQGTSTSYGLFLGVAVLIIISLVYRHTVIGYEMKQMGENLSFSRAGGVNTSKMFLGVFLISGFIAGLCGGVEVTGSYGRFNINFSGNIGWDGIMIARIAGNNPLSVIAVSLIWGALKAGSMQMERMTSLNRLSVNIIQMLFVLFVAIDYEKLIAEFNRRKAAAKFKRQEEMKC